MLNPLLEDDLVQEYLAESREHLATIEADLLRMEDDGAAINEELVNRVFRAAHSIKGGAGFFDFDKIRELAHKAESVLDMVRCGEIVPNSENVSILLLAFDKLGEMLANCTQSNEADISEFVLALTAISTAHLPAADRNLSEQTLRVTNPNGATPSHRLIEINALDLAQARRGGRSIYLLLYDLIHDIQRIGKTPLGVLRELMNLGSILETEFDLDSAGTLDDEPSNKLILEVLFASNLSTENIAAELHLPAEQVQPVDASGTPGNSATTTSQPTTQQAPPPMSPIASLAQAVSSPMAPTLAAPSPSDPPVAAPTAKPKAKPAPASAAEVAPASPSSSSESTIRLNVELLDSLMTLAGELVLSRNQLNEAVAKGDDAGVRAGAHRVSLVTSELQGAVALTRMQPVGSLFGKFPRLVRDLGRDLNKQVQLQVEGGEVEIDKTILEGLSDPLTHMIRNSVDHGIEMPDARRATGKHAMGTVLLRASHQAGQVVIEISDDGKGMVPDRIAASCVNKGMISKEQADALSDKDKIALIFLPGFSTAEKLSSVSGRGVGMDVVKTNLDKLGGKVDIDSIPGKGTSFKIKLPLTLAIIPSLLISNGGHRFAIPQVNVGELIRVPARQIAERIDHAADGEVLLLRDRLVPLLHLSQALGGARRSSIEVTTGALNIAIVDTGSFEYGLVVDELHDTVEIVVKPLGRHLQELSDYAGATILGDGQVAIILDVAGLAARAGLASASRSLKKFIGTQEAEQSSMHSLLLFYNAVDEPCAVPIELVSRVERIDPKQVQCLGGRKTMQYGNASLPLVSLGDMASVGTISSDQQWVVIVFERAGRPIGLLAAEPLDMIETNVELDAATLRQPGVAGSAILNSQTTLMLDIFELAGTMRSPEDEKARLSEVSAREATATTILLAEDSDFFRGQIRRLIESAGYQVLAAPDGQAAWELLEQNAGKVSVIATDLEMPRLDGLGLTRRIRSDSRFSSLPIIALSSLAGEEEIARAMATGISEYQVKLDQDEFLAGLQRALAVAT
jgi:two-component system, chemotaxis family, sensor kinase CheA